MGAEVARVAAVAVALSSAVLLAQTPAPAFETASVKPNQSRVCDRDGAMAGGRLVMTCATVHELMIVAYPKQDGRSRFDTEFSGGPSWLDTDHFDVVAKAPAGQGIGVDGGAAGRLSAGERASAIRIRQMLQPLLADRFKLAVHHERRDLPVYKLRVDRRDGALGPQMKKVDVDCASRRDSGKGCGGFRMLGPAHFEGGLVTMSLLVEFLESPVGRNVIDRTGLQGRFDVELQYAPAGDSSGISIFTALREQLGLKLESAKAPIDVLVIDHVEKPTAD